MTAIRDHTPLDRDTPAFEREDWDDEPYYGPATSSVLERAVELPLLSARWIVATLALVAAVLLRFLGLDRWPLSGGESDVALAAHRLVRGEGAPSDLFGMPFTVEWVSLFLFAGGSADSVARVGLAVAGVVAVAAALLLQRRIGVVPAVAAAVLLATSPTLVAASRRVDSGALLVALSLIVIWCALEARRRGGLAWAAATGVATALLALTGPLGIPAALLAWLGVYFLARPLQLPSRDAAFAAIAAGIGTTVLVTTVFLTRPSGFTASLGELLERFWDVHIAEAGSRFYMPAFNLILNEPLLIVLAIVAVVAAPQRELARTLGVWAVETLVLVSLLGDTGTAGYALAVLPLGLLAGVGAAHLVERLPWGSFRRGQAALYVVAIFLAGAALLSLFGLIESGVGTDRGEWLMRFVLVVGVGLLPLALGISYLGVRLTGHRGVLVLTTALIVIVGISTRSAVLAASERPGDPGEPLAAGALGADIPIVVGRVERLSRDLTLSQRDARDPTGGHGLRIAVDERVAQPFLWYFREFPNLTVFDPDEGPPAADAQLVILGGTRDARAVAPGYRGQPFVYGWETPEMYRSPDWGDLIGGIVSPSEWRAFTTFLIDRDFEQPVPERQFQLVATPDIASQMFPSAGPYTLDDRAGAGNADGQFNRPRGVALAPDGSVYVVDSRNVRVQKFSPVGEFVLQFGGEGAQPGQFARFSGPGGLGPGGIAIADDGTVFVADTWNHRVQAFGPDGQFIREWGSFFDAQNDPAAAAANEGAFYGPRDIAIHEGLVYVTDTGNERVQVFQPDGVFVRMFGTPGSEDGQLLEPLGIDIAADGTVLVADSHNGRIARFTPDGQWIDAWPVEEWQGLQFFEPYIAIAPDGTVYATTSNLGSISVFAPDGTPQRVITNAELRQPFGIAVGAGGNELFVSDASVNAVIRVAAEQVP